MDSEEKKSNNLLFYLVLIWIFILAITAAQRMSAQYGGFIGGYAIQTNVTATSGSVSLTVVTDADNDGINDTIDALPGNLSSIRTSGITTINMTIGGNNTLNATYSQPYAVTFFDGAVPLINFTHNFSSDAQLFLRRIIINISTTSVLIDTAGQLLPAERKTIWITNNDFASLCVKDLGINSTAEITSGCTGENETTLTSCLSSGIESVTVNNITCTPTGNRFKISNLKHSGILGTITSSSSGSSSSSSSGGGGGGGGSFKTTAQEAVQTSILSIERLLAKGDTETEVILLRNIWDNKVKFEAAIEGKIRDFVSIMGIGGERLKSKTIELNALESQKLTLLFEAKQEGIYSGDLILKRGTILQKVPLKLVIGGSKEELVGLEVIIHNEVVPIGGELKYNVNLYNLGKKEISFINLTSVITKKGIEASLIEDNEKVPISRSLHLTRKIDIPQTSDTGEYVLKTTAAYNPGSVTVVNPFKIERVDLRVPAAFVSLFPLFIREYLPIIMTFVVTVFIFIVVCYYFISLRRRLLEKRIEEKMKHSPYPFPMFKLIPKSKFAYFGLIADTTIKTYLDYRQLNLHTLIAGGTGCGKTVAGMVVVEELLKKSIPVIVFDPTGQWTGFFKKCRSKEMKSKYTKFSLYWAQSFNGRIVDVSSGLLNTSIIPYITKKGITIFKINNLNPNDADMFIANTLGQIYKNNWTETASTRSVIVLDEVHRLLPKYGGRKAYLRLEQAVREFRKWGIGLLMISQVLTDFKGAIRGNIGTEIQMRTRYEGDVKRVRERHGSAISTLIPKMPIGVGMVESSEYNQGNPYFVEVRPILHSPYKLPEKILKKYLTTLSESTNNKNSEKEGKE